MLQATTYTCAQGLGAKNGAGIDSGSNHSQGKRQEQDGRGKRMQWQQLIQRYPNKAGPATNTTHGLRQRTEEEEEEMVVIRQPLELGWAVSAPDSSLPVFR